MRKLCELVCAVEEMEDERPSRDDVGATREELFTDLTRNEAL